MRCIDADALIDELSASCMPIDDREITGLIGYMESIRDVINSMPAADVRPERHGVWIFEAPNAIGFFPVKCSNCGIKIATTADPCDWVNEPDHLYCGSCGAKMDGKEPTNGI